MSAVAMIPSPTWQSIITHAKHNNYSPKDYNYVYYPCSIVWVMLYFLMRIK